MTTKKNLLSGDDFRSGAGLTIEQKAWNEAAYRGLARFQRGMDDSGHPTVALPAAVFAITGVISRDVDLDKTVRHQLTADRNTYPVDELCLISMTRVPNFELAPQQQARVSSNDQSIRRGHGFLRAYRLLFMVQSFETTKDGTLKVGGPDQLRAPRRYWADTNPYVAKVPLSLDHLQPTEEEPIVKLKSPVAGDMEKRIVRDAAGNPWFYELWVKNKQGEFLLFRLDAEELDELKAQPHPKGEPPVWIRGEGTVSVDTTLITARVPLTVARRVCWLRGKKAVPQPQYGQAGVSYLGATDYPDYVMLAAQMAADMGDVADGDEPTAVWPAVLVELPGDPAKVAKTVARAWGDDHTDSLADSVLDFVQQPDFLNNESVPEAARLLVAETGTAVKNGNDIWTLLSGEELFSSVVEAMVLQSAEQYRKAARGGGCLVPTYWVPKSLLTKWVKRYLNFPDWAERFDAATNSYYIGSMRHKVWKQTPDELETRDLGDPWAFMPSDNMVVSVMPPKGMLLADVVPEKPKAAKPKAKRPEKAKDASPASKVEAAEAAS